MKITKTKEGHTVSLNITNKGFKAQDLQALEDLINLEGPSQDRCGLILICFGEYKKSVKGLHLVKNMNHQEIKQVLESVLTRYP